MMLPWQKRPLALNSPRDLPGLALWLDSKDVSSLRNDAGAQPVTTDGIKLASDKSGNSSTNVLCLNGVAGNYASSPDSAPLDLSDDITLDGLAELPSWATAANQHIIAKYTTTGNQRSYRLGVGGSGGLGAGLLFFSLSTGGDSGTTTNYVSTAAVGFSAFAKKWVRATRQRSSGYIKFYTSDNGTVWTQLGTTVSGSTAAMFVGAGVLEIGSITAGTLELATGLIYQARIYDGYDGAGTLVFDANFTAASKLAPSFTESSSNAATVTINTSGATGARISGARDLYQGTAANQPILTIAAAGNYLTFDGSNDYLKAAAFALAQPETVYFVGSQVTWVADRYFYDGGTVDRMAMIQRTSTPTLRIYASGGGSYGGAQNGMAVATNAISTAVYSGAASAHRINRAAAVAGPSVGTDAGNGFTLGSAATPAAYGNITAQEVLVYSGAHDKATQDRVIAYLANRNRIALT